MNKISINDILNYLKSNNYKYNFYGNKDNIINGYSSIKNYKPNSITWFKNKSKFSIINKDLVKNIGLAVVPFGLGDIDIENYIEVENPKEVFFAVLENFFESSEKVSIGKNSIISSKACISTNIFIGNNCVIDDDVIIESGCKIYNNVVIRRGVKIGKDCLIKSGAIIGEEGFGYSRNQSGIYKKVPHFGSVKIGNNVDIGASACIDRGTIDDTIIEDGTKIDNLCYISHNVNIGKNCMIIGGTKIYGSVNIGDKCYIATAIIKNQVKIGNNVFIGMGSIVTKNIEDNNIILGNSSLRTKYLENAVDLMMALGVNK